MPSFKINLNLLADLRAIIHVAQIHKVVLIILKFDEKSYGMRTSEIIKKNRNIDFFLFFYTILSLVKSLE